MGIYQYNTEQLKRLADIYCDMAQIEEPDLNIKVFVQWLSQENQSKKYLKIIRWDYGQYKGERIDECTDIPYLQLRIRNRVENDQLKKVMMERLQQLKDELQ